MSVSLVRPSTQCSRAFGEGGSSWSRSGPASATPSARRPRHSRRGSTFAPPAPTWRSRGVEAWVSARPTRPACGRPTTWSRCRGSAPGTSAGSTTFADGRRPWLDPFQRLGSLPVLNTRGGARRNIAAHYDLGNQLFELFLDREAMMYSSAVFEHPGQTLEEAQLARLERIFDRLELTARRPPAGDRNRLGRAGRPGGRSPRLQGDHDDDLARAALPRRGARARPRASSAWSRSWAPTIAT